MDIDNQLNDFRKPSGMCFRRNQLLDEVPRMRSMLITLFAVATGYISYAGPASAGVPSATNAAAAATPVVAPSLSTAATAPDALLSAATSVVTTRLKQDATLHTKNAATVAGLVESTVLPLFDFRHMTQLAVARYWHLASTDQQHALIAEFKTLLVRTYSAALANYRDEVIEYKPLHIAQGETDVTVKSSVKKPGRERMSIDYDMDKSIDGWKVYDIRIAGISLTTTYRSSFAEIIHDGGIDRLIKFLTDKNRMAAAGVRSDDSETRGLLFMYGIVPNVLRGHQ